MPVRTHAAVLALVLLVVGACHLDDLLGGPGGASEPGTPGDSTPGEQPAGEPSGPAAIVIVSGDAQTGAVGTTLDEPLVVRVVDAEGSGVTGVTVTWRVTGGGGGVSPAATVTGADGRASATHALGTTTGAHLATATVAGLDGSPSTFAATAVPGAPAQLLFSVQPSGAGVSRPIDPAVQVTVRDAFGNVATNFDGAIIMSITPLTGTPGATLSGTRTRPVVDGVARFGDLHIDLPGLGYRLRGGGAGLSTDSDPFNVVL